MPEGENTFTARLVCELKKNTNQTKKYKNRPTKKNPKKTQTKKIHPPYPTPPPLKKTGGRGECLSVHNTCPVNKHGSINYIFKSGLSSFSDIWPVIHMQLHTAHCWSVVTTVFRTGLTHVGSTCAFTCNFLNPWTGFNMPPVSLLYFKASFGVRRLIGVTEIEKGSSYGNQEFKKKE